MFIQNSFFGGVSSSSMNNFGVFCLLFGWRPAEYWIEYAQTVCIFITRQLIIYTHNSLCCTQQRWQQTKKPPSILTAGIYATATANDMWRRHQAHLLDGS